MPNGENNGFTAREMRYLRSLPAVERVSRKRISYADWFKYECMRKYASGGSPVRIFREAGLDPAVVGYKRIERCFARWRDSVDVDALLRGEIPMPERPDHAKDDAVAYPGLPGTPAARPVADHGGGDVDQLIIAQQARRINALEASNEHLREAVREFADGRHPDVGRLLDETE